MPTLGRGAMVSSGTGGLLLFMRENTVLAQRLDLDELRLEGEPVSVAQDVRTGGVNGRNSFFGVRERGDGLPVLRDVALLNSRLTWYRRDGIAGRHRAPGRRHR